MKKKNYFLPFGEEDKHTEAASKQEKELHIRNKKEADVEKKLETHTIKAIRKH